MTELSHTMPIGLVARTESRDAHLTAGIVAFLCASYVYASGLFRFLDLFGIKHAVAGAVLFGLVALAGTRALARFSLWIDSPFICLPAACLLSEVLLRGVGPTAFDFAIGIVLVAIVLSQGPGFSERVIKGLAVFAGCFAIMGLLQFVAIAFIPALHPYSVLQGGFQSPEGVYVSHPFGYLGQGTLETYSVFGVTMTRLFSFSAEPGATTVYFLLTGALALTLKSALRLFAFPSLIFSVISLSGTTNAAWLCGLISIPMLVLFRRRPHLAALVPFGINLSVPCLGPAPFEAVFSWLEQNTPLPSKLHSGLERVQFILQHMQLAGQLPVHPLGLTNTSALIGYSNLPLMAGLRYGVLSLAAQVWALAAVFMRIARAFADDQLPWSARIGLALAFGVFFQATAGTSFGFLTASGFMLSAVTARHAEDLASAHPHRSVTPGSPMPDPYRAIEKPLPIA